MINFLKSGLFLLIVLILFVTLLLILLRRFIAMNRLQKRIKENSGYLIESCYGSMGIGRGVKLSDSEDSYVGGKTRLLTDLVLEQEKKYIEVLSRLPESDKKNFILRSLRYGEALERKNNIVCEEDNKFSDSEGKTDET
ncbi:MAG: hypothetical protein E7673_02905 [Ruminococcaceae bacterium]|nr:hypothetical protein [Oscillospiraceae bacterium]